jgi:hypothetical protein
LFKSEINEKCVTELKVKEKDPEKYESSYSLKEIEVENDKAGSQSELSE